MYKCLFSKSINIISLIKHRKPADVSYHCDIDTRTAVIVGSNHCFQTIGIYRKYKYRILFASLRLFLLF